MSDESVLFLGRSDELVHGSERMQGRESGFEGLFGSRNQNLLQPFFVYGFPFRETAKDRCYFVHAHLNTFLYHPFESVDAFSRCNGDMYSSFVQRFGLCPTEFFVRAMFAVRVDYLCLVDRAESVGDMNSIACLCAKYLHTMI